MKVTFVDDNPTPETNEVDRKAMGGTELMKYALYRHIDKELLNKFQIIPSRVRELDESKKRVYWLHDLPPDPESAHLKDGGWDKFDSLVYVSNWQKEAYQGYFNIPPSKGIVMHNAIEPLPAISKPDPKNGINIIYHTTPHRGLDILVPVMEGICEVYDNVTLDVFSSFNAYGWPERDKPFEQLFERCRQHPKINYHGYQPNEVVREALAKAHIFAYPSIWLETSCIALMEAMSAGCMCVHPNLGALPETAANWTYMYSYHEDIQEHANRFGGNLVEAIEIFNNEERYKSVVPRLAAQKQYVDTFYSWDVRRLQWGHFLTSLLR